MSNMNDSTAKLLELVSKKTQLPLSLDYSLVQTDILCPKCKNGNIICIHAHTDGIGPTKGIPYDYDNFMHVCSNKDCDLVVKAALEDTPKNDKNLKRPNRCTLCGRSLDDKNRVFNETNT